MISYSGVIIASFCVASPSRVNGRQAYRYSILDRVHGQVCKKLGKHIYYIWNQYFNTIEIGTCDWKNGIVNRKTYQIMY
jgi:hypothetical protein